MTFLYGTNMELLYSMPVIGASVGAASAKTLISGNTSTNPPFLLPPLTNIWSPANLQGRGLMVVASGGYDIGAANNMEMILALDTTAGTGAANSVTLATMGLCTVSTTAVGLWEAQCWVSFVSTGTVATGYVNGTFTSGVGSTETGVSTALTYMWGQPTVSAGIPTAITVPTAQSFYVDLYSQFTANPTQMVCTQFMIFGLN